MTKDEFKKIQKGTVVRYRWDAPILITGIDQDYDYSTQPPTPFTYEIFSHIGTSLKIVDPEAWIKDTDILENYEGDCPSCHQFDLWRSQGTWACPKCSFVKEE
jgi:hypothetical protein